MDVDSLTEAFAEDVQDTDDFYLESFRRMKRISVIRTMAPLIYNNYNNNLPE